MFDFCIYFVGRDSADHSGSSDTSLACMQNADPTNCNGEPKV